MIKLKKILNERKKTNEMVAEPEWSSITKKVAKQHRDIPTGKGYISDKIHQALEQWLNGQEDYLIQDIYNDKKYDDFFVAVRDEFDEDHDQNFTAYRGLTIEESSEFYDYVKDKSVSDDIEIVAYEKDIQSWSLSQEVAEHFAQGGVSYPNEAGEITETAIGIVVEYEFDSDDVVFYYNFFKDEVFHNRFAIEQEVLIDMHRKPINATIIYGFVYNGYEWFPVDRGITLEDAIYENVPPYLDDVAKEIRNQNDWSRVEIVLDNIDKYPEGDLEDFVGSVLEENPELNEEEARQIEQVAADANLDMMAFYKDLLNEQDALTENYLMDIYEEIEYYKDDDDYNEIRRLMRDKYGLNDDAGDIDHERGVDIKPVFSKAKYSDEDYEDTGKDQLDLPKTKQRFDLKNKPRWEHFIPHD